MKQWCRRYSHFPFPLCVPALAAHDTHMSKQLVACVLLAAATSVGFASWTAEPETSHVAVVNRAADQRVDISVDGQPFTSYIYPKSLEKPVLYPIRSASGVVVTRGYPLEPRPGERADHPHHIGHWFNYGDVSGYDFWGNSSETAANLKAKTGVIVQKAIPRAEGGDSSGEFSAIVQRKREIARGVAVAAVRQRLGDVGAPVPFGAFFNIRRKAPVGIERRRPEDH